MDALNAIKTALRRLGELVRRSNQKTDPPPVVCLSDEVWSPAPVAESHRALELVLERVIRDGRDCRITAEPRTPEQPWPSREARHAHIRKLRDGSFTLPE
jgi:hypothetical protein